MCIPIPFYLVQYVDFGRTKWAVTSSLTDAITMVQREAIYGGVSEWLIEDANETLVAWGRINAAEQPTVGPEGLV